MLGRQDLSRDGGAGSSRAKGGANNHAQLPVPGMFRRLKSSFTGGSKGSTKVLFTVRIASLTGLTPGASCRVVWARQAKVQVTSPAIAAHNGALDGWNIF